MPGRTWFLALILIAGLAAVTWAVRRAQLPPADFTFGNESEVASVDPALTTGIPEARIVYSLFEGLCRPRPANNLPEPGVAEKWELSDDGLVYTFHLRADAKWSNGEPVTATDFVESAHRMITPALGAEYAYMLWHVVGAEDFNKGKLTDFARTGFKALD